MNIFSAIEKFIRRINEIDGRSKSMAKENRYSTNPFDFRFARTYAWIEKKKNCKEDEL